MKEAGLLDFLIKHYNLTEDFKRIYLEKRESSISFIDEIITQKETGSLEDNFYFSYLAMNEVFSAVRDEIRSIILFNNGVPLSRWIEEKNNITLPEEFTEEIYTKIETIFDTLFGAESILPTSDEPEENGDNFSEIVASLIFRFSKVKTQDAILLTTAILISAKYFVTFDGRLIKEVKDEISTVYGLILINSNEANNILRRKRKQKR